jgi:hypothetical protein
MIQGFNYSSGDGYDTLSIRPASAFSKGDLLCLTSASSLSRINELMASGSDILGIAESDSNQSIDSKVPVLIPSADMVFLASAHSATGTGMTTGQEFDIAFGAPNGRYFVTTSVDSVRVVIVRGTIGANALDQSVHSQVLVKLIRHGGNLELS